MWSEGLFSSFFESFGLLFSKELCDCLLRFLKLLSILFSLSFSPFNAGLCMERLWLLLFSLTFDSSENGNSTIEAEFADEVGAEHWTVLIVDGVATTGTVRDVFPLLSPAVLPWVLDEVCFSSTFEEESI
jgi:hypothetical protein